ncbi:MAG: response regulator transcription factor [Actinomycetota bacterium]|nr:response regulator transcription factor [Actinomycetota bacterium]MDI6822605.1 response regulator transcription factor [Actinomycetota bacterium]
MEKIKVLLADDHAILREGMRLLLEKESDMEVIGEAADGEEAIEKTREFLPDVVVMDIGMPKLNGLEATRRVKAENPHIGVLVLTIYEDDEYVFNLLKTGATGYLLKKVAASELVNAIRAVHHGELLLSTSIAKKLIDNYIQEPKKPKEKKFCDGLTDREIEILKLIAQGASNKEIAEKLYLSVKTVETHRTHIFRKLDIHDRTQAAAYAIRKGLLDEENQNKGKTL